MEYQKVTNLIDNISDQASKFRRKSLVKINDDSCGEQKTDSQIKFKTLMLKSRLCDYSDAYILVIVYIHIYTCEKQKNPEDYGNITEMSELLL